jgi:hypothetical protein
MTTTRARESERKHNALLLLVLYLPVKADVSHVRRSVAREIIRSRPRSLVVLDSRVTREREGERGER